MAKNKKVIKEQKKYQNLQERYEEMNDYLLDLIEEHRCAKEDLRYLKDFIHYKKLDEDFQGLKDKYIKTYGNSYGLESTNSRRLMRIFKKRTEEHGMMNDPGEIFKYLHEFPKKESTRQTTLF